jgi:uncharacterized protein involved in outer membrane biogenesis
MWWKRILIAAALILALLFIAVYAFLYFFDINDYKPRIIQAVRDATGRELILAGDLKVDISLLPVFVAEDVKFGNAPWGSRPELAVIKRFEVQIALLPLITGNLEIQRFVLEQPDIILETSASGQFNLDFDSGDPDKGDKDTAPPALIVHEIRIEDGRLTYRDQRSGDTYALQVNRFFAELPDRDSALGIDFSGKYNDRGIEISGRMGSPLIEIDTGGAFPVDLAVRAAGTRLNFKGEIQNLAQFSGLEFTVDAEGKSIADVAALAGLENMPDPGEFKLAANLTGSLEKLSIRELKLQFGEKQSSEVSIQGTLGNLTANPNFDMNFRARSDDFSDLEKIVGLKIPWKGPVSATGRISNPVPGSYRMYDLSIKLADNDILLNAELDFKNQNPRMTADIVSNRFNLQPLFSKEAFQTIDSQSSRTAGSAGPSAKREPADGNFFEKIEATVKMRTGEILLPNLTLVKLNTEAQLTGGRVNIQMEGPSLPDLKAMAGITQLPDLGPFRLACYLAFSDAVVSINAIDLRAGSRKQALVHLTGAIADITQPRGFDLKFNLDGEEAARLGKYLVQPWPLRGKFSLTGHMTDSEKFAYHFRDLRGSIEDVDFSGDLDLDLSADMMQIAVGLDVPKFNLRPFQFPDMKLPQAMTNVTDLGPLRLNVEFTDPEGQFGIKKLSLLFGTQDLAEVQLSGAIEDLLDLQGIHLDFNVRGKDVGRLEKLTGSALPLQGSFTASGRILNSVKNTYQFQNLKIRVNDSAAEGQVDLNLMGVRPRIKALVASKNIDLQSLLKADVAIAGPGQAAIESVKKRRILPDLPVQPEVFNTFDADLQMNVEQLSHQRLSLNALTAKMTVENGRINISAASRSLPDMTELTGVSHLTDLGQVKLNIKAFSQTNRLSVERLEFQAGSEDQVEVTVTGSAQDVVSQQGITIDFTLRGNDISEMEKFIDRKVSIQDAFLVSGRLADPEIGLYKIDNFRLQVGDNDLRGQLAFDMTSRHPKVKATLASKKFDLRFLMAEETDRLQIGAGKAATPAQRNNRVFSNQPFDLKVLKISDADIKIRADQVFMPRVAFEHLIMDLKLEQGRLTLEPVKFRAGGGSYAGRLHLESSNNTLAVDGYLGINQVDLGQILEKLKLQRDLEGILDAEGNLKSRGDSTAALMANLDGQFTLIVGSGRIDKRYIELMDPNLRTNFLQMLNPRKRKEKYVDLNCTVHHFQVDSGRANYASIIDTNQTTIFGGGLVDLNNERLDIFINPVPKRGIRIFGLGKVTWSLSEFTRPFKLGGTLANPKIAIDPTQTAIAVGKLLGGALLGPAGLAAAFANVSSGDENPCNTVVQAVEKGELKDLIEKEQQESNMVEKTTGEIIKETTQAIEKTGKTIEELDKD